MLRSSSAGATGAPSASTVNPSLPKISSSFHAGLPISRSSATASLRARLIAVSTLRASAPSGSRSRGAQQRVGGRTELVGADQRFAEGQRREWRDHGFDLFDRPEPLVDLLHRGEVVAGEQVGHVGGVVGGGEEQDHGLAAEVVLELAVVDRDLGVGVEIAVLTGGELDLREADPEQRSDHHHDEQHDLPALAERDCQRSPERLHEAPSRKVRSSKSTRGAAPTAPSAHRAPRVLDR